MSVSEETQQETKSRPSSQKMSGDPIVVKDTFIRRLDEVSPGLSVKDIVEQSSSFVFADGYVWTFNEEVACKVPSGLAHSVRGAVQAKKLADLLKNLPGAQIRVSVEGGQFKVREVGSKREAWLAMEPEITLPVDSVETPDSWVELDPDFLEAVKHVRDSAGRNEAEPLFTCVHIHPEWVEASDNNQMTRWNLAVPIERPIVVRAAAVKHVPDLALTEFGETPNWAHFRSPEQDGHGGLVLSCLKYQAEYHELSHLLEPVTGTKVEFPPNLDKAAKIAEIFSQDNVDQNFVTITIRPGKPKAELKIESRSVNGGYRDRLPITYDGPAQRFMVPPRVLVGFLDKHSECVITEDHKFRVTGAGGVWTHLVSIDPPPEEDEA